MFNFAILDYTHHKGNLTLNIIRCEADKCVIIHNEFVMIIVTAFQSEKKRLRYDKKKVN